MKIYPNNIIPINRVKSVKKKIENNNYILELNGQSYEEDVVSPIINYIPKKINLGSKKLEINSKRLTKNNGSIQKFIEDNLNKEKSNLNEDQLNKSTKIEKSNINKLIYKILNIKNNENMESIIKENIKKLRKYCYKFRKKKKKKGNKSQQQKNNININSNKLSDLKDEEKQKSSPLKIIPSPKNKKSRNYPLLKYKKKIEKLPTLNEEEENKYKFGLYKKRKIIKQPKTPEKINKNNINEEENVPYIHNLQKDIMRTSINERPYKFLIKNCPSNIEKAKSKSNKKKVSHKIILMRKTTAFCGKNIIKFSFKKEKKDKIELIGQPLYKKSRNIKNFELNNSEKKNMNNISYIQVISKLKKINYSSKKKKSKKKIIETPEKKNDNHSNSNTNYNTNIFTLTQSTNENNTKNRRKRSNNYKI